MLFFAQAEQIRTEYRLRARKLHPDKGHDAAAATDAEFKRLQQAYQVLADPERRAAYDQWLHSGVRVPFQRWQEMGLSGGMVRTVWVMATKRESSSDSTCSTLPAR